MLDIDPEEAIAAAHRFDAAVSGAAQAMAREIPSWTPPAGQWSPLDRAIVDVVADIADLLERAIRNHTVEPLAPAVEFVVGQLSASDHDAGAVLHRHIRTGMGID